MFDNTNQYTLRTEIHEGITRYYVSFADGQTVHRETEVSRPVYLEFLRFVKTERNLRRRCPARRGAERTEQCKYSLGSTPPRCHGATPGGAYAHRNGKGNVSNEMRMKL
jgi:hypothetical protein